MNIPSLLNFALNSKDIMDFIKDEYNKRELNKKIDNKVCVYNKENGTMKTNLHYVGETDKTIVVKQYIMFDKKTHKLI